MSVNVEKLENSMIKLTIEVPAEQFVSAMKDSYMKQRKDISIPGFRKGKVPQVMIEKMYGPEVFYEDAANALIPQAYSDAAKESGEDIMSRPEIDVTQMEKGKPFIFTAEVAVRPEITLGTYKGVEVTRIDNDVDDEEVMTEIDHERDRNARTVTVTDRPIQKDDTAVIDYEGFIEGEAFDGGKGENHSLVIGSGSFIPGFEDQLIGCESGDDVEVKVTFPEDYHAEELKGKEAVFIVKIHEVKAKELPEADDEFAQDVSEFDTFEEYKQGVKERLMDQKARMARNEQVDEALGKIIESSTIDIPEPIIETRADEIINQFAQQLASQGLSMDAYMKYTNGTIDSLREEVRPEAISRIQSMLVIDRIAVEEGIEVTDQDVEDEIDRMAESYRMNPEQMRSYMTDEEKESIRLDVAGRKAIDIIYDNLCFVDAPEPEDGDKAIGDIVVEEIKKEQEASEE